MVDMLALENSANSVGTIIVMIFQIKFKVKSVRFDEENAFVHDVREIKK